ncbi:MAG: CocE/NonD family hydrolase [Oscillochloris sp.]|nr:CocE/NonD family hydrolase [Oscillochloris sp.]
MSQRLIADDRPSFAGRLPVRILIRLALIALLAVSIIRARRRLIARLFRLRPPEYRVAITRDIPVHMLDGVRLYADHYRPLAEQSFPTILVRTPYGRAGDYGVFGAFQDLLYRLFAERGYHVIVQTVRGRYRSDGEFAAFVHEAGDGRATMEWVAAQPWFDGNLGMWGPSYLGYVQWAVAAEAPSYLKAIVPLITSSRFSKLFYPGGAFALESSLRWIYLLDAMVGPSRTFDRTARKRSGAAATERVLAPVFAARPLNTADQRVLGRSNPDYQRWLESSDGTSAYWRSVDHHSGLAKVDAAILLVAGWYDIFLNGQLADYAALLAAGRTPYLSILPVAHMNVGAQIEGMRQGLWWFDIHLRGQTEQIDSRRPVRLKVMGSREWHEMDFWPPPAEMSRYYLHHGGELSDQAPSAQMASPGTSMYRYDPADPTPSIGGPVLSSQGGPRDQRPIERRSDLLCFTTAPLPAEVDVIGHVRLELYLRSSLEHTDIVGRLCVVEADGRSINVCEGILRVGFEVGERQPDGSRKIEIDMWATAQRFRPGQRIRVHVCSAAHPRWSANPGSGEGLGNATTLLPATQIIYHDYLHPSALVLPIVNHATRARMEQDTAPGVEDTAAARNVEQ